CSCWRATYVLKNESGTPALNIVGPTCIWDGPYACCCENKFTIYGTDGSTEIGAVHKKYRGFVAEALTSADAFTIRIPLDLDVRMKAVALGVLFLIVRMAERSKRHPACQYETDKPWLDLQTHRNNTIKRPDELENEMKHPPLDKIDNDKLNYIHGSMLGMALGDIIGAHVEFRPREYLRQYPVTELKGGGTWGLKKGQYAVEYSGLSGLITHGDEKVYDACRYYSALIVAAVNKEPKEELLEENFYEKHKQWFAGKSLHPDIERIAQGSYRKQEGYDKGIRGKGYIVNALEAALWAFLSDQGSFENGVLAAVNLGDDTDTTAAIYGQLAGACYGFGELREDWVEQVYAKDFIECLSKWIVYDGKKWSPKQQVVQKIPYVTIQPPLEDDNASSLVQKKNLFGRRASKSPTEQLNSQSNFFSKFEQFTGLNANHRLRANTVIDRPSNLKSGSEA
ncbi:unnamed protein product, partial [Rotaria sordida]